jgi:4-carboxymuconolactone decarboxylase
LTFHLGFATQNDATEEELVETITHDGFSAGWPRVMSALAGAKPVFVEQEPSA